MGALILLAMTGAGCWWMLSHCRPQLKESFTIATCRPTGKATTAGKASALGLEDDPDQWRATCGAWTALDERQLLRLLTNSTTDPTQTKRPAANSDDTAGEDIEDEDTT
ncbi:hypothetical protein CVN56_31320 [Rhodococcus sp. AQ5-07]|nr:hypothetical protein CVN56_31320 [Rhodococcus sp. AQ5-07]